MVGGLMVYGEYPAMRRAVARALELGVTYFDTAPMYGEGQSEVNLGAVLRELRAEPVVGTKVYLDGGDRSDIPAAVARSVEASLRRLGRERVDLIQLHNPIAAEGGGQGGSLGVEALPEVFRAFGALTRQGKARYWGITALGDTDALHQAVAAGGFHTLQTVFNMLNPSAGRAVGPGLPHQDYRRLIDAAAGRGVGSIAIRVLAGGALSGSTDRHPVAASRVGPLATGRTYAEDVAAAERFAYLVRQGTVQSLPEAAIRFVLSKPELSVAMVGLSSLEQLEAAVDAANRGPLPPEALDPDGRTAR
jgi:aryl-alcohol dehydrogenase-like predicted oxidoreductase